MGATHYHASGPIEFCSKDGVQSSLPIQKFSYENGDFKIDDEWLQANPTASEADLKLLLKKLQVQGFLTPVVEPPPVPAMIISAAAPGEAGNKIQIAIGKAKVSGGKKTFDAEITQKITYPNLKIADLGAAVGTDPDSQPEGAMVFLSKAPADATFPKEGTYTADDSQKISIDAETTETAFELTATRDAGTTKAEIKKITDDTFTLTTTWTDSAIEQDVETFAEAFPDAITVQPPTEGGDITVPAAGIVPLSGGTDAKESTAASAVLFSDSES